MSTKIFIDGEAGTTGLQIREKLAGRSDIELVSLPAALRKDPAAKRELLSAVDLTLLCLPDEAAKEAARLVEEMGDKGPRVIDASSAHRVAPGWVYGFPEMTRGPGGKDSRRAEGQQSRLPRDRSDCAAAAADRGRVVGQERLRFDRFDQRLFRRRQVDDRGL